MSEWLPEDHLAWFVISVVDALDVSALQDKSKLGGAGRAGYDPRMLLCLLIYAYAVGERSSRQIERLCRSDVAFRVLCAQDVPDHSRIARFRQGHDAAVADLFGQVLAVCARAGLGRVGVVAVDGTKIAADASVGATRSERGLRAEAERILAEAAAVDAAEDTLFGSARGDELPAEWCDSRNRGARIKQALADLHAEAEADAQRAAAERAAVVDRHNERVAAAAAGDGKGLPAGPTPKGADPVAVAQARLDRELARAEKRVAERAARERQAAAAGRAICGTRPVGVEDSQHVIKARQRVEQARVRAASEHPGTSTPPSEGGDGERSRNVTDPDSRPMPTRGGFIQGYNAQLAVSDDQLILAAELTQRPGDVESFIPMMQAAQRACAVLGQATNSQPSIGVILADAGYASEANLTADGPDRLIALGKRRELDRAAKDEPTCGEPPADATPRQAMDHRLRTETGAKAYKRRGVTVEPVNGQLKDRIGLRRFARRGLRAAQAELTFAAAVHNLLKAYRATPATA